MSLAVGTAIEHERFGTGTIEEIDATSEKARIVVKFDNLDTKTLLLQFAKFKIIE